MLAAFPSCAQRAREGWDGWRLVFLVSYNLVGVEEVGCSVTHGSLEWGGCKKPATNMQNGAERLVSGRVKGNRR